MAQEDVLIKFEVDYSELTNAQQELSKTGKVDTKGFQAIQAAISDTATDTQGLIKQFKDVAGASVKMGKSIENAFGAGVEDALKEAGVSLTDFSKALTKANAPIKSVKTEMRELKEAMSRMKAEGKDTGKEFDALRARAGKLQDAIGDANAEIKNAGSDTRHLDNVVGSISALAGGFAAAQGAVALFGDENEDLQKTLVKVTGAMALAQGLQQVYNATLKEGSLFKLKDAIATGAMSGAQAIYTAAVGTSTGALRVFRIALLATGIGAIIVLLGFVAQAMGVFGDETDDTKESQDRLRESIDLMNESLDFQISRLKRLGDERIAQLESQGASETVILKERIKNINDEIKLLEQKEANSRRLADSEKTGSIEAQRLYKEANDFFYQQEALKSQIKIIGFNNDKKLMEDKKKASDKTIADLQEFNRKIKDEQERYDAWVLDAKRKGRENIDKINAEIDKRELDRKKAFYKKLLDQFKKQQQDEIDSLKNFKDEWAAAVRRSNDRDAANDEKERVRLIEKKQLIISIAQELGGVFAELSRQQAQRDAMFIDGERKKVDEQLKAGAITAKAAEQKQKQFDENERKYRQKAAKREKQTAVFKSLLYVH